jgi:hypothetical protein
MAILCRPARLVDGEEPQWLSTMQPLDLKRGCSPPQCEWRAARGSPLECEPRVKTGTQPPPMSQRRCGSRQRKNSLQDRAKTGTRKVEHEQAKRGGRGWYGQCSLVTTAQAPGARAAHNMENAKNVAPIPIGLDFKSPNGQQYLGFCMSRRYHL